MFIKFLLFLTHVFNTRSLDDEYTMTADIYTFYRMGYGFISEKQYLDRFLYYSKDKYQGGFINAHIDSFVVNVFLLPHHIDLNHLLKNILFEYPGSFKKYLVAESYQSKKDMWIKNKDTLIIEKQTGWLKKFKAEINFNKITNIPYLSLELTMREFKDLKFYCGVGKIVIYVGREKFNADKITFIDFSHSTIFIGSKVVFIDTSTDNSHYWGWSFVKNLYSKEGNIWSNKKIFYVLLPCFIFICAILLWIYYNLRLQKEKTEEI